MSGQIFISYRREDTQYPAKIIYDRLKVEFPQNQIFKDIDSLIPGDNFDEKIKNSVGSCEVLLAIIGKRWLGASDHKGKLRLKSEKDFVRLEIATALKRGIRVIPVMVEGALVPEADQLPDDLKQLASVHTQTIDVGRHFETDVADLVTAIKTVLRNVDLKQQERERLESEQREKERLEAERRKKERLEAEQREKQRLEAEQRKQQEKERLEDERRQRDEKEHLEAEQRKKAYAERGERRGSIVVLEKLDKHFSGTHALKSVDLVFEAGEIHAIIGENGAGKSTLAKLLTGVYGRSGGEIYWEGQSVGLTTPREAIDLGIDAVHQEVVLCPHLTVAANLFLGDEKVKFGLLQRREMVREGQKILDDLGFNLPAGAMLSDLTIGQTKVGCNGSRFKAWHAFPYL
jgi:ABC-type molybdenum transport system ATPase subunit/photorepair protein PhrA